MNPSKLTSGFKEWLKKNGMVQNHISNSEVKGNKKIKKTKYATLDLINDLSDDLPEIESQLKIENKQNTLEWISVNLFEGGEGFFKTCSWKVKESKS